MLGTILTGAPFPGGERRVGFLRRRQCCFLIAALARWCGAVLLRFRSRPLLTYNALFVPIFILGGLLCLVMSALVPN